MENSQRQNKTGHAKKAKIQKQRGTGGGECPLPLPFSWKEKKGKNALSWFKGFSYKSNCLRTKFRIRLYEFASQATCFMNKSSGSGSRISPNHITKRAIIHISLMSLQRESHRFHEPTTATQPWQTNLITTHSWRFSFIFTMWVKLFHCRECI